MQARTMGSEAVEDGMFTVKVGCLHLRVGLMRFVLRQSELPGTNKVRASDPRLQVHVCLLLFIREVALNTLFTLKRVETESLWSISHNANAKRS